MLSEAARALWAKSDPWHPLWRHLLDAAAVSSCLLERFWCDAPLSRQWLCFLVALHDIGKADALFQLKAPEAILPLLQNSGLLEGVDSAYVRGFRHESRSADWVKTYLLEQHWSREAVSVIVSALRGHHGDFNAKFVADERETDWHPLRLELAQMLCDVIKPEMPFQTQAFTNASDVGLKLSGLIVLSDWIASGTHPYAYQTIEQCEQPADYFRLACERARVVVENLSLAMPIRTDVGEVLTFQQVWQNIADLRPSQTALQECVQSGVAPGLMILEAPMGEGKTEAAVYLAEEWNRQRGSSGVYIALPTMATSNQMRKRYAKYLQQRVVQGIRPRLIHGMAWLIGDDLPDAPETDAGNNESEAAQVRGWFASPKRALIAVEGVGTVDQVLFGALNVKHGFLRLFGLSPKILIIDEVHAYDAFMQTILRRLLEWCRTLRIPVILLSATLSKGQKSGLIAAYTGQTPELELDEHYPLLTFAPLAQKSFTYPVKGDYVQKTIALELAHGLLHDPQSTAARAAGLVSEGGCVCVLVNTVRRAQEVFKMLEELKVSGQLDAELYLFHARFTAGQRDEIEKRVVRLFGGNDDDRARPSSDRKTRAILVATQVVEQSLDVCFDVMLTDIAPVDLLLQRAGRLHRHAANPRYRHQQPTLHVLLPAFEQLHDFGRIELKRGKHDGKWRGVYDRATLLKTLALLLERFAFVLPRDFRELIESVYGDTPLKTSTLLEHEIELSQPAQQQRAEEFEQQGRLHLIPAPDLEVFSYAQSDSAVDEAEDGKRSGYFRAQTRLGDDTCAVLLLTERNLINAFHKAVKKTAEAKDKHERYQPHKDFLSKLFLQKVNLPAYWLHDALLGKQAGCLVDGPTWLRHHIAIFAPQNEWSGTLNGKPITIRADDTLGVLLETKLASESEGVEGA